MIGTDMRDSCGSSVTGETPQAQGAKKVSPHATRKASSLEQKSTTLVLCKKQQSVYEKSLNK
ncbi:hypothetical protein E6W99_09595 [Metabacillus sediminilitoris]|uniref:Uncharacterized protein n=1 Tax=Metabacillus sediminilitoris TaxID=2567941 RepID=A0A4S4C4M6_9BACI|nr:hypothetical protein E6W99_09595 [Metabacillus sediminilitoris]